MANLLLETPDAALSFQQENPKKKGPPAQPHKSFLRYEQYKAAKTIKEVLDLGGVKGDILEDFKRKYLTLEDAELSARVLAKIEEEQQALANKKQAAEHAPGGKRIKLEQQAASSQFQPARVKQEAPPSPPGPPPGFPLPAGQAEFPPGPPSPGAPGQRRLFGKQHSPSGQAAPAIPDPRPGGRQPFPPMPPSLREQAEVSEGSMFSASSGIRPAGKGGPMATSKAAGSMPGGRPAFPQAVVAWVQRAHAKQTASDDNGPEMQQLTKLYLRTWVDQCVSSGQLWQLNWEAAPLPSPDEIRANMPPGSMSGGASGASGKGKFKGVPPGPPPPRGKGKSAEAAMPSPSPVRSLGKGGPGPSLAMRGKGKGGAVLDPVDRHMMNMRALHDRVEEAYFSAVKSGGVDLANAFYAAISSCCDDVEAVGAKRSDDDDHLPCPSERSPGGNLTSFEESRWRHYSSQPPGPPPGRPPPQPQKRPRQDAGRGMFGADPGSGMFGADPGSGRGTAAMGPGMFGAIPAASSGGGMFGAGAAAADHLFRSGAGGPFAVSPFLGGGGAASAAGDRLFGAGAAGSLFGGDAAGPAADTGSLFGGGDAASASGGMLGAKFRKP